MTDIRVTRESIEVLADVDGAPVIQASRVSVEVLTNFDTNPAIQMSRQSIEVLHTTAEAVAGGLRRTIITVNYL